MRRFNVRYHGFSTVVTADHFETWGRSEIIFYVDKKPIAYFSLVEAVTLVPNE